MENILHRLNLSQFNVPFCHAGILSNVSMYVLLALRLPLLAGTIRAHLQTLIAHRFHTEPWNEQHGVKVD